MTKASTIGQTLAAIAVLGALSADPARAADTAIGYVKVATGTVTALRSGQRVKLMVGSAVQEQDEFETGSDGTLGVTFHDNTRISLGPSTRLDMTKFVFAPADQQYGFALRLLIGTLEYISGLTGKLSPQSVSISTPNFVVAVRGTRLLIRAEP